MTTETQQVQHTPGPWRVSTRYEDSWNVIDSNGFCLDDSPMSILDGWPDLGYEHWGRAPGVTYIERSIAERNANARLIAAAPDLLAALERIAWEGAYKPTDEELDGPDSGHFLQILGRWDAGERARTALCKARGEDA